MHITVTDSDKNPISGAYVSAINHDMQEPFTKTTDSAGGCNFELSDGTWAISCRKDGYPSIEGEEIVVSESATDFKFTLQS